MESIGPVLASVRLAVVLGLLVVLPGVAIGPYLAPGATTRLARLGRAVGVGLLATSIACFALALFGLLRPTILATVLAGLSILPLHADRPQRPRLSGRARRWWATAAIVGLAATSFALGPSVVGGPANGLPLAPASWTGVPAALALAETGALPSGVPAWNGSAAIALADMPAASHLAAAIQLLPGELTERLLLYRVALTLAAVVIVALLLRRWLPSWPALAGGGLFAGVAGGMPPLLGEPTTGLPLVLAVFAMWLADRAIVERSVRLLATTALVASFVLLARIDFFLVAAAGITAVAAGRWLVAPGGGPETAGGLGHRFGRRLGLRRDLGRATLAPLTAAVALFVGSVALGTVGTTALSLVVPAGGVLGIVDEVTAGGPRSSDGPSEGSTDPSWALLVASTRNAGSTTIDRPPSDAVPLAAGGLLGGSAGFVPVALIPAGVLIAGLAGWPFLDARRQRLVATAAVFGLLVVGTSALILGAAGPFGVRRLATAGVVPFGWLVTSAASALAAWRLASLVRDRARGARPRARQATLALVPLLVVPVLLLLAGHVPGTGAGTVGPVAARVGGLTAAGAAAWREVAAETPGGARILTNARTDGIAAALGARTGVIDGPDPDPRDAGALARATSLIDDARGLFTDPTSSSAAAWLGREGVSHLLVAGPGAVAADLGGRAIFETDLRAILGSPRFELLRSFEDRVYLFAVVPGD